MRGPAAFGGAFAYPRFVHQPRAFNCRAVSESPAVRLSWRHGHGDGTAAVSSLWRSAGRSGVRLHPCRDHCRPAPQSHDWLIRAHRHRNLFQILLIERGGGEMTFEAASLDVRRACRDPGAADDGAWLSLSCRGHRRLGGELHRGRCRALGERSGEALKRLKALAAEPVIPLGHAAEIKRLSGSAPISTRKASWRARASAWRCADCWR